MILTFLVRNQTLTYLDTKLVPRIGSAEYLQLKFKFITSDWVNLRKTIQISSGEYSESYILESDIFDVPTYYTQQESFDITFLGDKGGQVVPTNVVTVKLDESNRLWTASPPDPQSSAYLQLMGSVGNLADLETVSKDNLVAAVNEVKHTADSKQDTLIQSGASVGQIAKISAVDGTGKPTAWEAMNIPEQVQSDWNQNDNTQPDYVKNKPFYLEKTLFIELTKDDFTVNNQNGHFKYIYRSTPKLDWFVSAESIAFEVEIVDINGRRYTATQDSLDVSVENDNTDEGYEYWSCYSHLFEIVSGVDLDFYDDEYYYKDEWGVLVGYYGIEFSEINIKIYRVDVKKIPEICLDAAIGKTAITVGSIVYGSEGEMPTNVVVPDLLIPATPSIGNEEIYYDRRLGRLRTTGDLFPYIGRVDYTFSQAMPTTAGSSISFYISSEGDTLWDKIGWHSPWSFGKYLTFVLHSYYMDAGEVIAGGTIEFLSSGNDSILAGTAVAVSSSGNLYTVVLKYTNNYKTLNVTIKCVA